MTEGSVGYGPLVLGGLPVLGILERHLDRCARCRGEAERLDSEAELIRRAVADLELPDDFTDGVWVRVRRNGPQIPMP